MNLFKVFVVGSKEEVVQVQKGIKETGDAEGVALKAAAVQQQQEQHHHQQQQQLNLQPRKQHEGQI